MFLKVRYSIFAGFVACMTMGTFAFARPPLSVIGRISCGEIPDQTVYAIRFESDAPMHFYDLQQGPGRIKVTIFNAVMAEDAVREVPGGPIRYYTIQRLPDRITIRFDMYDDIPVTAEVQHDSDTGNLILALGYVDRSPTIRVANRPPQYRRAGIFRLLDGADRPPRVVSGGNQASISYVASHSVGSDGAYSAQPEPYHHRRIHALEQWEVDSPSEVRSMIRDAEALASRVLSSNGNDKLAFERLLDAKLASIFETEQQLRHQSIQEQFSHALAAKREAQKRERDQRRINAFRKAYLLGNRNQILMYEQGDLIYWRQAEVPMAAFTEAPESARPRQPVPHKPGERRSNW